MTAVLHPVDPRLLDRTDLTVDDLANLPEDLRYELIDGRLVLTPHAVPLHQLIVQGTCHALEQQCPEDFVVNVEQALRTGPRSELRPDVMLMREEGAAGSPVLPIDVDLVVEVVSPSSQRIDRVDKLKWYADAGIPAYWIIDPLGDRVTLTQFALTPDGTYEQVFQTDESVTLREPWELTLDLPAWTRRRDRIRTNARPR